MVKERGGIRQRERNDGCDKALEETVGLAEEHGFDLGNEKKKMHSALTAERTMQT